MTRLSQSKSSVLGVRDVITFSNVAGACLEARAHQTQQAKKNQALLLLLLMTLQAVQHTVKRRAGA